MNPRPETSAAPPPAGLTVHTLGRLEIRWAGKAVPWKLRKTQALLVYLALEPGPHDRSRLAGLLWGDRSEERARRNLRHALSQLRRSLDPALLVSDRRTVGLNEQVACRVDARLFEEALAEAGRRRRAGDAAGAIHALQTALDLYRGEFLAGFDPPRCPEFEEWAARRRAQLHQQALDALAYLATYHEQRGEYEQALRYIRRQLALEPWWEEGHRTAMRLLALLGQRSAALAQYETCRRLLQEELGLEPLEETQELYGKLVNWEIGRLGIGPPGADSPQSTNLPTYQSTNLPFIGREDEHAALVAWWQAARRGRGSLALVEGEAGVGKTRLVEEVLRYAESQGAAILRGRCYEFGSEVPYQPIAGALRAILHSPFSILHSPFSILHSPFSILDPVWLAELSRLLPELRQMHPDLPEPVQVSGEAARQRLFEAVARFLSANPAHPLCLFLDDLHWADRSTLDLLHYLVRHLPDAVWFVGTYRPEEVSLDHPLVRLRQGLSRDHRVNRLALEPLSAKAVADIARALVGEESGSAFGDRLYRESEGNPFILIETVRDWQEQGLLHRAADGHWRWAGAPSATLPLSVQEVILQRVGRLSETAQRLLALAAVIGRHFDLALLQAAAGADAPAVDASLDEWLARRLILQPVTRNLFDFSHDKIRAAVYHALGTGRRRLLHRRVGEALEHLHSQQREAVYEQLAYHYEQAGAADPAWTYLLRAGDKAAALYAHPEALDFYDRALALAADDDRRRETLLRKGRSLLFLNRYEEAIACWRAVISEGEGDALAAQAANDLSNLHYQRREYEPAYHWAGEAQRWAVQSHDPVEESRAWQMLAQVEQRWGDLDQARQRFEEALAAYRELDDEQGAARCLDGLGRILAGGGRQAEARDYFEQALTAYRTLGDRRREAACLRTIGITHWREGDNEAARRALVASQEIYRAIGDRQGEAAGLNSLGLVYIAQGDRAETQRCWEESAAIYRALGLEKRAANVLHNLAILHLDRGEYAAAQRYLEESLAVNLRVGDQLNEAMDRGWLGKVHLRRGEYGPARRYLEKAVTLDREAGGSEEEGWHHTWLGAVAYEQGDLAAAQTCLATARRCVKAQSASLQRQDVYRWLAVVSLAQGQGEAALDAAHRALAEAERLGKPPADQALLGTVLGSGLVTATEDPIPHFERALSLLSPDTPFEYGLLLRRYGAYLLRHGQPERGAALLQEAQTFFARIGAGGEEEKVRRLLAGDETPRLGW